jgi:uncharacterized membrane protein YdfJ with MMPL/SSD domain
VAHPALFLRTPFKVLGLALVAAIAAIAAASGLSLDVSSEALIPPDSPQRRAQDEVTRLFGAEESARCFAADPALFTPAGLAALREVHDALAALPSIARVDRSSRSRISATGTGRWHGTARRRDPAGSRRARAAARAARRASSL